MYENNKEILGSSRFSDVEFFIGKNLPISGPNIAINMIQECLDSIKTMDLDTLSLAALERFERNIVILLDSKKCLEEYLDQYDRSKAATIIRIKDLLK